jgi:V/A-type H+-transporting ATPase subunit I
MITPMLKTALIVPVRERERAVALLGELGVLHIRMESRDPETGDEETRQLAKIRSAISILKGADPAGQPGHTKIPFESDPALAERILDLERRRSEIASAILALEEEEQRIAPIGEFDPQSLLPLAERGLSLHLYHCSQADLKTLPDSLPYSVVAESRGQMYLAVIQRKSDEALQLPEMKLPTQSLSALRLQVTECQSELAEIDGQLSGHRHLLSELRDEGIRLTQGIEIDRVTASFRIVAPVAVLEGYCPEPDIGKLHQLARNQHWGALSETPGDADSPPTLIRSSSWTDAAQPLYRLINSLPGYRELDVTPWFLIFFATFFAVLIGDAGYGALLLLGLLALRAFKPVPPPLLRLGLILGGITTIWGALTGNWFGVESLSRLPVLRSLIIPELHAFTTTSQDNIMLLCFLIGTAHLTLAHFLLAVRRRNSLTGLAQIGWMLIVWSAFLVVRFLVLEKPIPDLTYSLLVAGLLLVILFTRPDKNIFRGVAVGIGSMPLKLMSCFSDIISYLRLFAVGIATLAVAASFNEIATTFGSGGFTGIVAALLILLVGHSLNLLMAGLSVIVHGVRLNMLEFSGHADMEWTGNEFKPFRIQPPVNS